MHVYIHLRYQNNHVSPSEIESILQEHPDVKECVVFGKKDPTVQELISAVIVPKEHAQVSIWGVIINTTLKSQENLFWLFFTIITVYTFFHRLIHKISKLLPTIG